MKKKIQIYTEKSFREIVKCLSNNKNNYYSYQLNSSKSLVLFIKVIESVDSKVVKEPLEECGFAIKAVIFSKGIKYHSQYSKFN